jgi:hypothetical protein
MRRAIAFTSAAVLGGIATVVVPLSPLVGSGVFMN